MPDQRAAECRRKAQECRDEAARALNDADRQTWLRMADEWMALARSAEETAALNRGTGASNGQNSN
jgi:gluconate kinase